MPRRRFSPRFRRIRLLAAVFLTFSCDGIDALRAPAPDADVDPVLQPVIAHADVETLGEAEDDGLEIRGKLLLTPNDTGVAVEGTVMGLEPGAVHAFHVHEHGDCSAPDGSSAGGHFAPNDGRHGSPAEPGSHLGDLGNILADAEGNARVDVMVPGATLSGETGLVGRAFVLHAEADDLETQPAGDAGERIACGIIEHRAG